MTESDYFYIVYLMNHGRLGGFELLVILGLMRLGKDAYGVTVRQEIEERIGREISIGARSMQPWIGWKLKVT